MAAGARSIPLIQLFAGVLNWRTKATESWTGLSSKGRIASALALAAVLIPFLVSASTIISYALSQGGDFGLDSTVLPIALFTFKQAVLSALFSTVLAVPTAWLLWRLRPRWGGALLSLFGACFTLPPLAAVLAVVSIHGQQGWLSTLGGWLGSGNSGGYLYGLPGILLAHTLLNLPYAIVLLHNGFRSIPPRHPALADQLGLSGWSWLRHVILPSLRPAFAQAFLIVFLVCFSSFTVVFMLGGGPAATTLEVAIYEALKYDFDLATTASLCLLQASICAVFYFLLKALGGASPKQTGETEEPLFSAPPSKQAIAWGYGGLMVAGFLSLLPLASLLMQAFSASAYAILASGAFWRATGWSLLVAAFATLICNTLSLVLLSALGRRRIWVLDSAPNLILAYPPFVLGSGLFIWLHANEALAYGSLWSVVYANALMALPFSFRLLRGPMLDARSRNGRLADSLGINGMRGFMLITLPQIKRPLLQSVSLATALSFGDFSAAALFGSGDWETLPLLVGRLMGSYKGNEAEAAAFWMLMLVMMIFWLPQRFISKNNSHA